MRLVKVISVICVCFFSSYFLLSFKKEGTSEELIQKELINNVNQLQSIIEDSLLPSISTEIYNPQKTQRLFLQTRQAYKSCEWATEYFMYSMAKKFNGPPVMEAELDAQMIVAPHGLQLVETYIFPSIDTTHRHDAIVECQLLLELCHYFKEYFQQITFEKWQIFDALKLEVFRIECLGITGYDNAETLHSSEESADALVALKRILATYSDKKIAPLIEHINDAITFLEKNTDFATLDRARFITQYANPITQTIATVQAEEKLNNIRYNRLLSQDAPTLFAENIFNPWAFAPSTDTSNIREKTILGKEFFNRPIFTTNGISCATCHQANNAFAENIVKHSNVENTGLIDRNTPSLINACLQPQQFADMRAMTLEEQINIVVHNSAEMQGSLKNAANNILHSPELQRMYANAFGTTIDQQQDSSNIISSLATYIRTLVNFDSRWDQYMRGQKGSITQTEINGFNLFMGKAKCATCHFMPLFNGTLPPKFITMDAEVIGTPISPNNLTIDPDIGLYNVLTAPTFLERYKCNFIYAFKTPSIRNATRTAPYMHNGAYANLDSVIEFYNQGGGQGLGIKLENQTLSSQKLNLTDKEKQALISFINALSTP